MQVHAMIIGGGIAGLQAAIQLGRYMHDVVVVDSGIGRSVLCRRYNNILGWADGVSGETIRSTGRLQAERLGVKFVEDEVIKVEKTNGQFWAVTKREKHQINSAVLLLATGVMDHYVPFPGLIECLGISVFICPDCDGYEVRDMKTIVIGAGNSGANMALSLAYWTDDVTYINHEQKTVSDHLQKQLTEKRINMIMEPIAEINQQEGHFSGVRLDSGMKVLGDRAFIAFGGNEVRTGLAHQLGAERLENGHLITDPRTKMTSIPNLWAAGDIGVHSEMLTVAMAEGTLSAIWMHKALVELNKKEMVTV